MKNLRTHIWLCFTLGVFFLIALLLTYFVMLNISHTGQSLHFESQIIHIAFINIGVYLAYVLIVLFKAIKYTPESV